MTPGVPELLAALPSPVTILVGDLGRRLLRRIGELPDATVVSLSSVASYPEESASVALVVQDLQELRRVSSVLPDTGRATVVACCLTRGGDALLLTRRPEWPAILELTSSAQGASVVRVDFKRPVDAREVLLGVARSASPDAMRSAPWPVLGVRRTAPASWPIGEPGALVLEEMPADAAMRAEIPDLALAAADGLPDLAHWIDEGTAVTGAALPSAELPAEHGWSDVEGGRLDPVTVGPLDHLVINPAGFQRSPSGGVVHLRPAADDASLELVDGEDVRPVDPARGVLRRHVRFLRQATAVQVDWTGSTGPEAYCRAVAGLAMAGVPVVSATATPGWAEDLLGADLSHEICGPEELGDDLQREERSIRQRRAALTRHSATAWRAELARRLHLVPVEGQAASILLATRRPDMVAFAVRQLQRQVGLSLEILVATHGFEPGDRQLAELTRDGRHPVATFPVAASVPFGEVLNSLVRRATTENVVKVDDDDWYGPHFVHDLLLAQAYSAADVVGCPAELCYLEPLDKTIRRKARTEMFHRSVAGGTMLVRRGVLSETGGFRPHRKFVDAGLLRAVREGGGTVYRTHGLGYMLRRGTHGHTWDPGVEYFLQDHRVVTEWSGFAPTSTLAVEADCRPPSQQP